MNYKTYYNSPIGRILLVSDGDSLIGLWLEGQKYFLGEFKSEIREKRDLKILKQTCKWLDDYFLGKNPKIEDLSLEPRGSLFRKKVWDILCKIPYGKTITYGEIAKEIAKQENKEKISAQAVGGAVAHNPISIIIPCHRVIGANGNLTGYAGGIDKKIKLLKHEGVNVDKLFLPRE